MPRSLALLLSAAFLAQGNAGAETPKVGFDDVVRRALASHPSAAMAELEVRRAEGSLTEQRSASLPGLAATGQYTRLDADRMLGERVVAAQDQLSGAVSFTVPLVLPQRWAQWAHAREGVEVAKLSAEELRRQVAMWAGRAYLAALAQQRVLSVIERSRATAAAHFEFARSRREGGVGNRLDELRAGQELASVESQVELSRAALIRAHEALGVLAGAEGPLQPAEDPALVDAPTEAAAQGEAEGLRQDLKAARSRAEAARHIARDSFLDYLPSLLGSAQAFYQNPPTLVQPQTGWQAQILLSVPLFDSGTRSGQATQREALADEAKAQVDGLLRQVRSEVRTSYESLRRADAALEAARRAADRAREALQLATRAYQAGATTNLEVVDAERRARDAESAAVVAEDGVRQARLDLLAATGHFP